MTEDEWKEIARLAHRFLAERNELGDMLWPARAAPEAARAWASLRAPDRSRSDAEPARPSPPKESTMPLDEKRPQGEAAGGHPRAAGGIQPWTLRTDDDLKLELWELPLEHLGIAISECFRCPLGENRNHFVFGEGNPHAQIIFIGEAPGAEEDRLGRPFVGPAGKLLTRMITAMRLRRSDVYIGNIIKCRPPGNRQPTPIEVGRCMPYLRQQIKLIQPKLICALGRVAAQALLEIDDSLGAMRGKWHDYQGIKVMVTYHPAALLRNPGWKREAWNDLKRLRFELDGTQL